MKVLVVGSGAREHALAWKLAQSPSLTALFAAPGNPGIARHAACEPVPVDDVPGIVALAQRLAVDLVVVGPEAPLTAGLADRLREAGIAVFGPSAAAARLEGSKEFAKEVLGAAGVPTAAYRAFDDADAAEAYAVSLGRAVVKADGIAAGKGVIVAANADECRSAVRQLMREKVVGDAARRVVVEELLEGEECSAIALCDGARYLMLPGAQDHKRLGDGDTGPNTGGMGAYSPVSLLAGERLEETGRQVIAPVLAEMRRRGAPFVGALFAGLMMTRAGPRVLEYNCRLGDPETQPLVMRVANDLLPVLAAAARGDLSGHTLETRKEAAVAVVLAAPGYPGKVRTGDVVGGLDRVATGDALQIFHAGTKLADGRIVAAGGRVLTVCALGADIARARVQAYAALGRLELAGGQFRRDIGARAIERGE